MEGATLHRNQQTKTVFKGKDEKLHEQRCRTISRQKQSPHEEPTPFPHRLPVAKTVRGLQEGSAECERKEARTICKQPLFPSSQKGLEASLVPHASCRDGYLVGFESRLLCLNSNFTAYQLHDLGQVT